VSLTGVTGARAVLAADLAAAVGRVKTLSDIPVCVGFGVSTPEHAREIARFADGVVVGSAIVERIERARTPDEAVDSVARFVAELKAATKTGTRGR
jgi:tryptophan synthase alpha chain